MPISDVTMNETQPSYYDALVKVDTTYEYVPIYSTVLNLVDLVEKVALSILGKISHRTETRFLENHYWSHLYEKSYLRCLILLIPIIGNITIYLWDEAHKQLKEMDSAKPVREGEPSPTPHPSPVRRRVTISPPTPYTNVPVTLLNTSEDQPNGTSHASMTSVTPVTQPIRVNQT